MVNTLKLPVGIDSFEKIRKIRVSKYAYSEDFIFEGIEEVEVLSYKVMRDKLREAVQLR